MTRCYPITLLHYNKICDRRMETVKYELLSRLGWTQNTSH